VTGDSALANWPELSVAVLAYNEEGNVQASVAEAVEYLEGAVEDWELLLVDDGSSDRTGELCDSIAAARSDGRIRVFHHSVNQGMGGGLQTAYAAATKEWVFHLPADGQIDPASLDLYFPHASAGADVVTGAYDQRGDGPVRWVLSRGLRSLIWLATQSRVTNHAPYLFRRSLWASYPSTARSFFLNQEFVIRCERAGVPIATIMTRPRPRMSGESKVAAWPRIKLVFTELVRMKRDGL
jgi:glycosyltransferase involved in cell wall biosynthesis